jgi:hypothetical protein
MYHFINEFRNIFQEKFLKSFNHLVKSQIYIFYNLHRTTLSYGLSRIKSSLINMVSTITFLLPVLLNRTFHDNKRNKAIIFNIQHPL